MGKSLDNYQLSVRREERLFAGEWRDQLEALMTPQFLWSQLQPPAWLSAMEEFKRLPEREQCVICYELLKNPQLFGIEFSQKPGRHEVMHDEHFPTITTKVKMLIGKRFLTAADLLLIQGFPLTIVEQLIQNLDLKEVHLRSIAGNSFELGAIASTLIAVLVYWPRGERSSFNESRAVREEVSLEELQAMFDLPS